MTTLTIPQAHERRNLFNALCDRARAEGGILIDADLLPQVLKSVKRANSKARGADAMGVRVLFRDSIGPRDFVAVAPVGGAAVIEGWSLLGIAEIVGSVTLVQDAPGKTIPAEFRDADMGRCDHCGTRRHRHAVVIVQHEDGRTMQVGRSCVAAFLPSSFSSIVSWVEIAAAAAAGSGSFEERDGFARLDSFPALSWLRAMARSLIVTGTSTPGEVTWDDTCLLIWGVPAFGSEERRREQRARLRLLQEFETHGREVTMVEELTSWVLGWEDSSNFAHNLRTIFASIVAGDVIGRKAQNLIASAWKAREKALGKAVDQAAKQAAWAARDAAAGAAGHLGTVGDKITVTGKVDMLKAFDSRFGITTLIKIVSDCGAVVSWFASNKPDCMVKGARVQITGTVKEHKTFHDVPETVMTRCKAVPVS